MKHLFSAGLLWISLAWTVAAQPYHVSPVGDDGADGSKDRPFATVGRALQAARNKRGNILLRGGVHYLKEPWVFRPEDSGTQEKPLVVEAFGDEKPVVSGGVRLSGLEWQPVGGGVFAARVAADLTTEEIFVNGQRQVLARYPNMNRSAPYFDGHAADAISKERAARWKDPRGGYFHAMHPALWGDFTWKITGKDPSGAVTLEGGWQNNRGGAVHPEIRFVENIREELDAPGEWFLEGATHTLYYQPPAGLDLRTAVIEATRLRQLIEFRGTETAPVRFVTIRGLTLRQAARTVMETREPLMRSDWAICRAGAVFVEGAEDCRVEDVLLDQVGGNAIFVNGYNRRVTVRGCHIVRSGANGICFVGDPQAARSPLFHYEKVNRLEEIDRTPGPKGVRYPAECLVDDCLIHETGRVEKQTAGVQIQLAQGITIRSCSIYDMPRAGINIGDGCWGGHVIEFCDVFDTVKETGDHGSFNSWGRDRFWRPDIREVNAWVREVPELPFLDALRPTVLRNNRWRCDHGWDIDLDDGSTHYILTNNLCLRGGIKNREGYRRVLENNIMVGGGFHPHVWYAACGDVFRRNIVWTDYQPALMHPAPWGADMDRNLMHRRGASGIEPATSLQQQSGRDAHSVAGDAQFVDPDRGDYRVKDGSPALALGFVNFPMDQFGVRKPALRAMARTPVLPGSGGRAAVAGTRDGTVRTWLGARVRNVVDAGEMSALGLPGVTGVRVLEVPPQSLLGRAGMQADDVILTANGVDAADVTVLLKEVPALVDYQSTVLGVSRGQRVREFRVEGGGR